MNNYLISYDLADDRLRTRAAKLLLRHGCKRLQKSVFFGPGFSVRELGRLRTALHRLLDGKTADSDSVLCFPVSQNRLPEVLWEGDPTFFEKQMKEGLFELL